MVFDETCLVWIETAVFVVYLGTSGVCRIGNGDEVSEQSEIVSVWISVWSMNVLCGRPLVSVAMVVCSLMKAMPVVELVAVEEVVLEVEPEVEC